MASPILTVALIAASFICVFATTVPNQVHIAFAGDDSNGNANGMAVSWQTVDDTTTSVVKFGLTSGAYDSSVTGASSAYFETFHHHVVLKDLAAASTYFYVVGDVDGGFSKEYQFTSAPLSSDVRSFSFAVFADLGLHNGASSIAYVDSIKDDISLVWQGGDVSYADDSFLHKGCLFDFCYENVYDEFMNEVEPWARYRTNVTQYLIA